MSTAVDTLKIKIMMLMRWKDFLIVRWIKEDKRQVECKKHAVSIVLERSQFHLQESTKFKKLVNKYNNLIVSLKVKS